MSGNQNRTDEAFEAALRARLEAASRDINATERQRLDSARRAAVARASALSGNAAGDAVALHSTRRWLPAAALGGIVLLAVLVLPQRAMVEDDPLTLLESGDLAAVAELELLEDLELLAWLDEQDSGDAS